jgi:hypothetical protein
MLIAWKAKQVSEKKAFGGNFNSIEDIIENCSDDFLFTYIYPLYSEDLY